jgi:hypothetical protein
MTGADAAGLYEAFVTVRNASPRTKLGGVTEPEETGRFPLHVLPSLSTNRVSVV